MRILNVRFKNLNSLIGEWSIDFTNPEYLANGIFSITGPTGAGKSTILDAVCLALYGETPRLGKITKSTNEIMSRQTGECFSEVEFETVRGRFRCHFSQRRAYGKGNGELQSQKHEIVDAQSNTPLETKLREVVSRVTELTGMDFDRFTRSILLAQGGFSKFLLAKASERAPILEKITGTEIYSRISVKVHEQTALERQKLETVTAELQTMQLLPDEEKNELQVELKNKSLQASSVAEEMKSLVASLAWLENIRICAKEIERLAEVKVDFLERKEMQLPVLQQLNLAEKAMGLEAEYARITSLRTLQKDEKSLLEARKKEASTVENGIKENSEKVLTLAERCKDVEAIKQKEAEIIRTVRVLDTKILGSVTSVRGLVEELREIDKREQISQAEIVAIESTIAQSEKEAEKIKLYGKEHEIDALLVENLEGIRHQVKGVEVLAQQQHLVAKELTVIQEGLASLILHLQKREKSCQKDQLNVTNLQQALGKTQDDIRDLLGKRKFPELRQDVEALGQRQRDLTELAELLEKTGQLSGELEIFLRESAALEKKQLELLGEAKNLADTQKDKESIVRHLIEKRDLLQQVRSLEEQRLLLVDGAPCPLCGSLAHPYVQGMPQFAGVELELQDGQKGVVTAQGDVSACQVKQVQTAKDLEHSRKEIKQKKILHAQNEQKAEGLLDKLSISPSLAGRTIFVDEQLVANALELSEGMAVIAAAERAQIEEQRLQKTLSSAKDKLTESSKVLEKLRNEQAFQLKEEDRLQKEHEVIAQKLAESLGAAIEHLRPFGIENIGLENSAEVLALLTQRREVWKQNQDRSRSIDKKIASLVSERKMAATLLEKLGDELQVRRRKLKEAALVGHELSRERKRLYGTKNPEMEEERLEGLCKGAKKAHEVARDQANLLEKQRHGLQLVVVSLSESIVKRLDELRITEAHWQGAIQAIGFVDEACFLENRLDRQEVDRLIGIREKIQKEEIELVAQTADRQEKFDQEKAKHLTDRPLEELLKEKEGKEESLNTVQQEMGAMKARLAQDKKSREEQHEKIVRLAAQKKECGRWEQLHTLIGSSDGKKFRMFAQGLTFEMMITHANRKLQEMSDRYILIRDSLQPLELNIIDNYQAGEIRSTKNLSGGESFIVSLALALGLSGMASRNVRVDSLFLDEGFGSLDDEALETALETLSGLHQEGKLIGVISHVSALKERIATQIQVIPGTGGHSRLNGPGCVAY